MELSANDEVVVVAERDKLVKAFDKSCAANVKESSNSLLDLDIHISNVS